MPRPVNSAGGDSRPGAGPAAGRVLPAALDPVESACLTAFFRDRLRRLDPLPPGPLPEPFSSLSGRPLPRRPRALILDVYGTLLVSGAGEVGTAAGPRCGVSLLGSVLRDFGLEADPEGFEARFQAEILADHEAARGSGLCWPEVDSAALLARITGKPLGEARLLGAAREAVLNPAFPMPGAEAFLTGARKAGLALGIVSNAQYYTVPVLEAAFGRSLADLGFEPGLCVWSWRLGRAKPDPELFRILSRALAERGMEPEEAVYVGNDILNDISSARSEGYRTALFAGDARSLRLRTEDPRTEGVLPDTVLTSFLGAGTVFRISGRDPFLCAPLAPGRGP